MARKLTILFWVVLPAVNLCAQGCGTRVNQGNSDEGESDEPNGGGVVIVRPPDPPGNDLQAAWVSSGLVDPVWGETLNPTEAWRDNCQYVGLDPDDFYPTVASYADYWFYTEGESFEQIMIRAQLDCSQPAPAG